LKPLLLVGNNDQASYKYAESVAVENSYTLIVLQAKEFPKFLRQFNTSTLDAKQCLFYLSDAEKLSNAEAAGFLESIDKSPHIFILSGTPETSWFLKQKCLYKLLDETKAELTNQLKIIMTEDNRALVREYLKDADLPFLFNIMKFAAWQQPEVLEALTTVSQNLYKTKSDYLLTMLSYVIPPKIVNTFRRKTPMNPLEVSILKKIKDNWKQMQDSESTDVYFLMKACKDAFGVQLQEDEEKFLDVNKVPMEEEHSAFVASLEDYF
jgi:hypothetical protein